MTPTPQSNNGTRKFHTHKPRITTTSKLSPIHLASVLICFFLIDESQAARYLWTRTAACASASIPKNETRQRTIFTLAIDSAINRSSVAHSTRSTSRSGVGAGPLPIRIAPMREYVRSRQFPAVLPLVRRRVFWAMLGDCGRGTASPLLAHLGLRQMRQ